MINVMTPMKRFTLLAWQTKLLRERALYVVEAETLDEAKAILRAGLDHVAELAHEHRDYDIELDVASVNCPVWPLDPNDIAEVDEGIDEHAATDEKETV